MPLARLATEHQRKPHAAQAVGLGPANPGLAPGFFLASVWLAKRALAPVRDCSFDAAWRTRHSAVVLSTRAHTMKTILRITLLLSACLLAGPGGAATDVAALRVQALAATCATCHGSNGHPVDGGALPGLAGLPATYLAEQLQAFKTGRRPATVMHQISRGYSDAQLQTLAAYFAAQPR